ncbi:transcription termination/antitermination factor NusG [Candidatus Daviesbacteria bacterium]|nr:transcription termination/antitermination factor NusG [Candidatus Daviesbacteria bacterium]
MDDTKKTESASEETANPFVALKEFDVEPKEETVSENSENSEKPDSQNTSESDEPASISSDNSDVSEKSDSSDIPSPSESSEPTKPEPPSNPNAKWYVVHTFAGHENKVATALKQRIEAERLENLIFDILVPTQDKIEIRGGKKETVKEKIFPGYILIKMELNDTSWLAVRTTQGVTSFIGAGNKPTPISEAEVATIVKFTTQGAQPTFKDVFMVDDTIKIIDGPFAEFIGKVDSVDKEKGRVRVLVSIFGRETPVELDFLQVQKL